MGGFGLDLQRLCHNSHLFDPAYSDPVQKSAVDCCRRVGQLYYVVVVEYAVQSSFNDYQITNNLKKAIPGIMSELNRRLISGGHSETEEKGMESLDKAINLGRWTVHDGHLVKIDSLPEDLQADARTLEADELAKAIFEESRGDVVVLDELAIPDWREAFQAEYQYGD